MAASSFDIARGSGLRESTAAMAPPLRVEERLRSLEARMTALEQLRDEMRTGHVMIVTALTEQIEESRRHTRVLFEEALSRIAFVSEGLTAQGQVAASLATNLAALAVDVDESRTETRAMFDTMGTRLTLIEARLPAPHRKGP